MNQKIPPELQRAIKLDADAIECDVPLSQEGTPVIIHDNTETANKKCSVHELMNYMLAK
ncbi:MAG TPA: glycerophosphodiester phosphodiesterase family protein [Candidatus Nanoarchaeia archaeon]|nr:glycerophosphodiester phosphodiesterase family protein [Candidatus Nanoarchaeia archaeon]